MSVGLTIAGILAAAVATASPTSGGGVGGEPVAHTGGAMRAMPAAKASRKRTKYCVMATSTGSRVLRKICRTRDEWLVEGFDPFDPK